MLRTKKKSLSSPEFVYFKQRGRKGRQGAIPPISTFYTGSSVVRRRQK